MRKFFLILATLAAMVVCGVGALVMTLTYFMELGTSRHGNYEYYGQVPGVRALIFIAGAIGLLAPGIAAWYLWTTWEQKRSWRFSLRTALLAMTLIALLLGIIAIAV